MKTGKRRCETCKFFEVQDETTGRCRKSAPHALLNLMANAKEIGAVWPKVDKADWCGEWQGKKG